MGLQEPPAEPDSWVPVVRALAMSDPATSSSMLGARLVDLLNERGIEARQRSYAWNDSSVAAIYGGSGGGVETHIAVLVHERDREAAIAVADELNRLLERQEQTQALSDDELARAALDADRPPEM